MTKYSDEFKIKAVQMVLKDNTVESVTRMLNIPSHSTLCAWLAHYNHGGIHQLLHKNRSYSPDFKQKVLFLLSLMLLLSASGKNNTLPTVNQGCCLKRKAGRQ